FLLCVWSILVPRTGRSGWCDQSGRGQVGTDAKPLRPREEMTRARSFRAPIGPNAPTAPAGPTHIESLNNSKANPPIQCGRGGTARSEEHTSELQSCENLVC